MEKKFKQKPLSKKHEKFLDRALELSKTSKSAHKHGAILVKGSKIISSAVNVRRNDPYFLEDDIALLHSSTHAEEHCLRIARKVGNLSGAIMYIARSNKKGEPMNSKPCRRCIKAIKQVGIRKIFYTISNEMDLYDD